MNEEEQVSDRVSGERDTNSVTRFMSAQSRVSNILAIALMSFLGLGALTWYYANTAMRTTHVRETAQSAASQRAQGELPLPSLGRILPPAQDLPDPPIADPPTPVRMLTEIAAETPAPPGGGPSPSGSARTQSPH